MAQTRTRKPKLTPKEQIASWRNRIVDHADVDPRTLKANPNNWRTHPENQRKALVGGIDEVGYIRSVTVNKRTGYIVDGHLRVEEAIRAEQATIPVEYVDISEDEEREALLLIDPLAAMAGIDSEKLRSVIEASRASDAAVQAMIEALAEDAGIIKFDPTEEWDGMPEFVQDDLTPERTILVHFADDESVKEFAHLVDQPLTDKTKYIWYPRQERRETGGEYVTDES